MLTIRYGLVACLLALSAQAMNAASLVPNADAYVRDGSYANTNYGTASQLLVKTSSSAGYNRDSYIRFDLSTVSGTVSSATLQLDAYLSASGSQAVSVYNASNSWGETTVTWNTRPPLGTVQAQATVSGTAAAWYNVDVTSYVASAVAAGATAITFGLHNVATSETPVVFIASRETTNGPKLSVTTGTSGGTTTGGTTTTVPAAPSGLTASAASTSQINLAWVDNSTNESGFYVELSSDGVNFTQLATLGSNVTSYSVTSLASSSTYYFRVRAFNSAGTSAYSNVASATTLTPPTTSGGTTVAGAFYVSTTGSDSNPGTETSPWRTMHHALQTIQAGQTLYVRGGTYVEDCNNISIHPGTATSPILVAAYPGERPVLQGLLWLTNPSYWTINGLNVTWNTATDTASEHMVKMTNGVGWTYENSEIWGAHSFAEILVAGTVSGQPANWRIAYNCIHDTYPSNSTNQDHLIYANTGMSAGAGLIERNIMYNATNGEAVKLAGPTTAAGTVNVTVRYNTMYNTSQTMLVGGTSANNQIYRNLMYLTNSSNANIRGYSLTGSGDVAYDNAAGGSAAFIKNDSSPGVVDQGGELYPVNPQFNSIAPWQLYPTNTACQAYGVYAP